MSSLPRRLRHLLTAFAAVSLAPDLRAEDWPAWRFDAARSGASTEELPETLQLQWVLELPTPRPAWPSNQDKLQFDRIYEPILVGDSLIVPSMLSDTVTAFDSGTAAERWTFHAGGPIRFAAAAWNGKVYCTSDDGYLYCLSEATGALLWRFRGGPSDKLVLGNDRLVSAWPARGAAVVHDGTVYFGASIWPFMGVFIHALDAESGDVVWTNSGTGSNYLKQQHDSSAFAGVAPQGYMAVNGKHLVVAGGRTLPAVFDRETGEFLHFNIAARDMGSKGGGGYEITTGADFYLNRDRVYRMKDSRYVAPAEALIVTEHAIIGKDKEGVVGYQPRLVEEKSKDRKGKETTKTVLKKTWTATLDEKVDTIFIMSGSRLYATSEKGEVMAIDLPRLDRGVGVSWKVKLPDRPLNMITGDGKLFVSTNTGRIYCFGGGPARAELPAAEDVALVPRGSEWRYLDDGSDQGTAWRRGDFDDDSWRQGKAVLGYGDSVDTELSYGSDKDKKHVTTYFRREFEIVDPRRYAGVVVKVLVDDGAVVYLNGVEVKRFFIPDGEVKYDTLAATGTDEKTYYEAIVPLGALAAGSNVLAVEVHQAARNSSDLRFDLELTASRTSEKPPPEFSVKTSALADAILEQRGQEDAGYCLALGLGSGRLAEAIAARSRFHVVVVDPDERQVDAFRRRLHRRGVYGSRIAAVVADPLEADLPPFMAELVVAEDPGAAGIDAGEEFVRRVFHVLRPYSGTAVFEVDAGRRARLEWIVAACRLDGGSLEHRGDIAILRRVAPPSGAGSWTHQYADASNRVASDELLVKPPLGLLWFGGPSNEGVLPRHGHGPTPQVAGGRLVIEGRDMLRAVDPYTGRLLWERRLQDVGKFYDYTSHEPGANALGSNYVTLEDGVYVVHQGACLRLEPSTGETIAEFRLPAPPGDDTSPDWGYLGIWEDILVAGAAPLDASAPDYTTADFKDLADAKKEKELDEAIRTLETIRDFELSERESGQKKIDHFVESLNDLLYIDELVDRIPSDVRKKAEAEELEQKLATYLTEVPGRAATDMEALILKRQLLAKYYSKLPKYERKPPGKFGSMQRMASKKLVAMSRFSGAVLWEREAHYQMRHNAICLGGGKAFYLDRMPETRINFYKRRGLPIDEHATLAALDIRSGDVLWSTGEKVFGTWLGYSAEHDVLLQAGSKGRDLARDEVNKGMVAYRGASGEVLWENEETYNGPCVLLDDWVITQVSDKPGFALDIRTGAVRMRRHPITGEETKWGYTRNYGCNYALGCPNILTFRSAAAGYFDLAGDGGTGNFGGFRSGCTSNLIPAGGILNAPDYTRTCTCSYQNQASLAFVHTPEVEMWTFSPDAQDDAPVARLGLNFGAPGDRPAPDGTRWLDFPSTGGTSPDVPVEVFVDGARYVRHHPSTVESDEGLEWVASSGLTGAGEIAVKLRSPRRIRVRNEVAGGSELATRGASLAAAVPVREVSGLGGTVNLSSLGRAGKQHRFEGRIAGYTALAASSVTVELWARADADFDFVDARVDGIGGHHGFVIDNRELRARYWVAAADGKNNDRQVEIKSREKIADGKWVHIAFTYDAPSGTGRLFLDGKEVAKHDGPDGRPLWWDERDPDYLVGAGLSEKSGIDEVRICDIALSSDRFLNAVGAPVPTERVLGHWRMEPEAAGRAAGVYTVRLVFAEIEGLSAGERVFDVGLQGETCIRGLDIARAAAGPGRTIVREFSDIRVVDHLRITLTSRGGAPPILCGVEVIARSRSF